MTQCRFCKSPLTHQYIDLGDAPPSNSYLKKDQLDKKEAVYPLKLFVCGKCFLVQLDEFKAAKEIFDSEYAYFSSYSQSWLDHSKRYVEKVAKEFHLSPKSKVVEIASNDGYLLQYFQDKKIPCLGVEPTQSTADVAIKKGIKTVVRFFGEQCANDLISSEGKATLIAANNVLAHVPDINDLIKGIKILLADDGVFTAEFPHLLQLAKFHQFDTIYHEHFSYFSFMTMTQILKKHGLRIFDVEELPTHGGSLRIYADHGTDLGTDLGTDHPIRQVTGRVGQLLQTELGAGMGDLKFYSGLQEATENIKLKFNGFLLDAKKSKKKVAAFGAAAKGNTLLNYCGVKSDGISFVAESSPYKQGKFLPGSHIPILAEDEIRREKPDYVIILPWNLKNEISEKLSYIRAWDGKFVLAIPDLTVY